MLVLTTFGDGVYTTVGMTAERGGERGVIIIMMFFSPAFLGIITSISPREGF